MMLGRPSTRDIAVAARALLDARIAADLQHHQRVETALAESRADRARMHTENQAALHELRREMHTALDALHARINGLLWKVVGWQGLLIMSGLGLVGYLVTSGVPWLVR